MKKVSDENRAIAKKVAAAVGGNPSVTRFWDEDEGHYIDLLLSENRPIHGVTTVASVGLSDVPLYFRGEEHPVRVEILGCCRSQDDLFPNMISTASFCIVKDHWFCCPGVIYPDVVSMYYPEISMRHLFFSAPFLWEDALSVIEMTTKKVTFLLCVPISENERRYAVENSSSDLEKIFERENIDIFDLRRKSVI
ncbi:MAG: suppressor of fused domain protein [Cyanobacteria bacterium J06635_15]